MGLFNGVRRCGKSTLLLQFQDLLKAENPAVPVVSINLDLPEFRFLAEKGWKEIYDYVQNLLQKFPIITNVCLSQWTTKKEAILTNRSQKKWKKGYDTDIDCNRCAGSA